MKNKLLSFFLNQYFLSLVTTLLIIYFSPNYFTKYKLELIEQTYVGKNYGVYFYDLNNNNLSEKIVATLINPTQFIIYDDHNNIVDQWNFSEALNSSINPYWFFDTDNNGYKEIYFTTQKEDSVFLNIVEPFSKHGISSFKKNIFVDTVQKFQKKFKVSSYGAHVSNFELDSVNELFFTLNKGFGGYPRNVYKYNFKKHTIAKSNHLTNISYISSLIDINNDGFDEILFKSHSYGNKLDSSYTFRSDKCIWINVLDYNLTPVFDPIEIKVENSDFKALPFKRKEEYFIIGQLNSRRKEIFPSKLMIFSTNGKLLDEKELGQGVYEIFLNSTNNGFVLFDIDSGKLEKINFNLEHISSVKLVGDSELLAIDINEDGKNEWLNVLKDRSRFIIYDGNFKEGHSFDFSNFDGHPFFYGIKKTRKGNQLYIQNNDYYYLFNYSNNQYFYFKYLVYFFFYLLILGFVLLIIKGQKIREEKKLAIEKEVAELQLKTIKNQVDPHFVFNAINTISGLILTDKKLEADEFICNFSDLIRSTLQKSNKISSSLEEEIEFIEKYIQLQQVRFKNSFEYLVNIDVAINLKEEVPKHVLYSYVENAIKHGLIGKENGLLKIDIGLKENQMVLVIEDNGGGFDASKNTKRNSTGNGLLIMEKIYSLYTKLYKNKISHKIKEVFNNKNEAIGVKVTISISL